MLAFIVLISVWTPLATPRIAARWLSWPNLLWFAPVPILTVVLALTLLSSLRRGREMLPFVCSFGLFFLSFTGLVISCPT